MIYKVKHTMCGLAVSYIDQQRYWANQNLIKNILINVETLYLYIKLEVFKRRVEPG